MSGPAKCVEIEQREDGTFRVYECAPKEEAADIEGAGGQDCQSLDEALQAASTILSGDQRTDEQAQLDGYNKGKPAVKAQGKMPLSQVFGE